MSYLFLLLFSLLAGGAIGLFYFGGLWWTVRRMPDAHTPVILLMGSFMLRSVVAVTAFYLVAADWVTLVTAVIGFLFARLALVRYWGPEVEASEKKSRKEGSIDNPRNLRNL